MFENKLALINIDLLVFALFSPPTPNKGNPIITLINKVEGGLSKCQHICKLVNERGSGLNKNLQNPVSVVYGRPLRR